jgi:hypothetical protein
MPPQNRSKRHTERRRSKNIPTEVEIPNASTGSNRPAMPSVTQKKDSFTTSMVRRESKTEVLPV